MEATPIHTQKSVNGVDFIDTTIGFVITIIQSFFKSVTFPLGG
jgi:hypothetical protein